MSDKITDLRLEQSEQELCTQLMTPNVPGTHFCQDCAAPLTSYASTGPFEHLFAEGHVYRRAAEHPQRLIVVLGIWLIFGISALTGGFMLFASWSEGERIGVMTGFVMLSFSIVLIWKTTRNYSKRSVK